MASTRCLLVCGVKSQLKTTHAVRFPASSTACVLQNLAFPTTVFVNSNCLTTSQACYERQRPSHQKHNSESITAHGVKQILRNPWQELNAHRRPMRFSDVPRILRQLPDCPKPALYLGVGGLIPFVAPSLFFLVSHSYIPMLSWWQTVYAASVLSFMGGVRWGHAIPNADMSDSSQRSPVLQEQIEDELAGTTPPASKSVRLDLVARSQQHTQHPHLLYSYPNWHTLGYAIIPQTVAWGSLLFPSPVAEVILLLGIAGVGFYDVTLPGYPEWFKSLRLLLTLVACTCLTLTLYSMVWYAHDVVRAEGA